MMHVRTFLLTLTSAITHHQIDRRGLTRGRRLKAGTRAGANTSIGGDMAVYGVGSPEDDVENQMAGLSYYWLCTWGALRWVGSRSSWWALQRQGASFGHVRDRNRYYGFNTLVVLLLLIGEWFGAILHVRCRGMI